MSDRGHLHQPLRRGHHHKHLATAPEGPEDQEVAAAPLHVGVYVQRDLHVELHVELLP